MRSLISRQSIGDVLFLSSVVVILRIKCDNSFSRLFDHRDRDYFHRIQFHRKERFLMIGRIHLFLPKMSILPSLVVDSLVVQLLLLSVGFLIRLSNQFIDLSLSDITNIQKSSNYSFGISIKTSKSIQRSTV